MDGFAAESSQEALKIDGAGLAWLCSLTTSEELVVDVCNLHSMRLICHFLWNWTEKLKDDDDVFALLPACVYCVKCALTVKG